jgi:ABC-type uncharacterized transport system permease subunit
MTLSAHFLAAGLYALAAILGARSTRSRALPALLGAAVVVHAVGFLGLHREEPPIPLENTSAALSLIGWLVASSFLLSLPLARTSAVGLWVSLVAGLLTTSAGLGLAFGTPVEGAGGAWPHAHVLISAAGFALLALSGLAGTAYLAKERALKSKRPARFPLPSLESLDRLEYTALCIGFPLLTLGVLSGYAWVFSQDSDPFSLHAIFLVAAWCVFLVPVTLRVFRREQGPRVSRSVVFGFVFLAVCYFGIRLVGGLA